MIEKERQGEIQINKEAYKKGRKKRKEKKIQTKLENKTTIERGEEKCV